MCKDREKLGERKVFESFFFLFNEFFHLSDLPKAHKKDVPDSGTSENLFYALFHAVGMWDFFIHHHRRHQKTIGLHLTPFFPLSGQ